MDDNRNGYRNTGNEKVNVSSSHSEYRRQTPGVNYGANGNRTGGQQRNVNDYYNRSISKKDADAIAAERKKAMRAEVLKQERKKQAKKEMVLNNVKQVSIILAVVVAVSLCIALVGISCIKDVLAINISEKQTQNVSVEIEDGMDTGDVISALDHAGVIKNGWFCKIAAKIMGYEDTGYIAGTYDLNRSMGLENMLEQIKNSNANAAKTVTLTFPEGYTADQIIEMLETNNVCTREKILEALASESLANDYDFLKTISNPEQRYIKLEGYLFPDTYEFYIGETADSVVKKFLNNFKNKWTDNYAQLAQQRRLSVDQVIRLASIVEKEAAEADMPVVASILHNRMAANMKIECDSTKTYISSNKSGLTQEQIDAYNALYDTYICSSLPVGAICNPGIDAIEAVLNAPDTDYYYFIHDANNEIRLAKTLSEQENNIAVYGLAGQQ